MQSESTVPANGGARYAAMIGPPMMLGCGIVMSIFLPSVSHSILYNLTDRVSSSTGYPTQYGSSFNKSYSTPHGQEDSSESDQSSSRHMIPSCNGHDGQE